MSADSSPHRLTKARAPRAVCVDCRSVKSEREPCARGHHVAMIQTAIGRERLLSEVWGPPSVRRRARQAVVAGTGGAATGAALEGACDLGCGALDCASGLADLPVLAVIAACAAIGVIGYLVVSKIVEVVRRRRNAPRPAGALRQPPIPHGNRRVGTALRGAEAGSSPSGRSALAWGLVLECRRRFLRSARMLSAGESAGFAIQLDDGTRVRVPPGPVRLEGPAASTTSVTPERVASFLAALDPLRLQVKDELDPFPFDRAVEHVLGPDDRVELVAELEARVDNADAAAAGYREGAATVLVPKGPVLLRVLPRGPTR